MALARPPIPRRGLREGSRPSATRSPRPALRTATRLAIRCSRRPSRPRAKALPVYRARHAFVCPF
jgi:hypothetical protein